MVINKKIKRTVLESKSQYLGSMALIIISCLLFVMFNLLSQNLSNITDSFEKDFVQEDASFVTDKKPDNISQLEKAFNIKLEETDTFDYSMTNNKILRVFTENTRVNIPAIIKGEEIGSGEILIDPAFAKANKLNIGDGIKIYNRAFKISGFMSLPNYIYPLKSEGDILTDANNFGIAVIKKGDFNSLKKGNSYYSIKFNDKKDLENQMARFRNQLRSENVNILNWMSASVNPRITFVKTKLSGINQVSSSMPAAILLLSCILTGIVMWRMLKRESPIIGTLYALGYSKKQIQKHYIRYPLYIAVIGGIIGTILGSLLLKPMLNLMVSYFNMPVGKLIFSMKYMIIGFFLPVVFLGVSGFFVIMKALKSSPLELIRGGKEDSKVNFLEKNLKLDRFSFSTRFKIREQLRSIPRSLFLIIGIAIATMLLLMGFAAKSSLEYVMKDGFEQAFKYNYQYVFKAVQKGSPSEGEPFSEALFASEQNEKMSITAFGVSPNSKYINFTDKTGKRLSTQKVIITRPLADKLNVKAKDTLSVINKLDSKKYKITIDSIAETYVGNYIYLPLSDFNKLLGYPSGSYFGLWSKDKLDIPENELLSRLSTDDLKNALNSMTEPIQTTVGTMAFMSFIIGLIVIYVVTSMIVEENKENISLMKILGYRKKEVYSLVLNSSALLVVVGYLLGIPMLMASLGAMLKSLTMEMSISLPLRIDISYLIIGFIIIFLTYEISKALSKRKVNRVPMNEILKSRLE